jgi:hypothetical protein
MMKPLIESAAAAQRPVTHKSPDLLPASFPALPADPQPQEIESFLHQLTQVIEQIECMASESDLKVFVYWALEQSYSNAFTQDQKFQLLSLAWEVQKLLWSIRTPFLRRYE